MRFSPEFIEKVRESNNLVEIISSYTELRRTGHQMTGLCPFPNHNEKTPSFSVSEDKQVYYCFGCKAKGNIYSFLQDYQGLTFPEAVEFLAQRAGIDIPKEDAKKSASASGVPEADKKKMAWKLNKYAAVYFFRQLKELPQDHVVREYCERRGLSQEIIETFHIGFAKDDWSGLAEFLHKKGAPLKLADTLGLVRPRKTGNGHYDLFRGRLIFPIVSATGNFIGFGGRVIDDGQPKYLNSPDSFVFHKGQAFYGLNETAKYIRSSDQAIVVEGYMDLIALYRHGFKNVVATLGTALTEEHARLLSRYTKNVLVLFDGDAAGVQAAKRSAPILLGQGLIPRWCLLENNQDPDDFLLSKGAEALKQQIALSDELFIHLLQREMKDYSGSAGDKIRIVEEITPMLLATQDHRLRELYFSEVVQRLQVEPEWLKRALGPTQKKSLSAQNVSRNRSHANSEITAEKTSNVLTKERLIRVGKPVKAELYLVNLALMDEDLFKEIVKEEFIQYFQSSGLQQILQQAKEVYGQIPSKFANLTASLVSYVEDPTVISMHLDDPFRGMDKEGANKLMRDCLKKVREQYLRSQTRKLAVELSGKDPQQQLGQLERIMNIQKSKRDLQKDTDPT